MKITVELSGGLDICFDGKKSLDVQLDESQKSVGDLIQHLRKICNQKKADFFINSQDQLRPGILVLVNDFDWELDDRELAQLNDQDVVCFISTLHGG